MSLFSGSHSLTASTNTIGGQATQFDFDVVSHVSRDHGVMVILISFVMHLTIVSNSPQNASASAITVVAEDYGWDTTLYSTGQFGMDLVITVPRKRALL